LKEESVVSDLVTAADIEQAPTVPASTQAIMSRPAFALGLDDIRNGKPFDPPDDHTNNTWAYERGRLFGAIAPLNMPPRIRGKLNPQAVRLCEAAFARRLVI
jgi:hypothetical protein